MHDSDARWAHVGASLTAQNTWHLHLKREITIAGSLLIHSEPT